MVKAVVRNGVFAPCEPLPTDWREGMEVDVEKASFTTGLPADVWMSEVEALAATGDPADDARLDAAIAIIRRREKDLTRKKLGL